VAAHVHLTTSSQSSWMCQLQSIVRLLGAAHPLQVKVWTMRDNMMMPQLLGAVHPPQFHDCQLAGNGMVLMVEKL